MFRAEERTRRFLRAIWSLTVDELFEAAVYDKILINSAHKFPLLLQFGEFKFKPVEIHKF